MYIVTYVIRRLGKLNTHVYMSYKQYYIIITYVFTGHTTNESKNIPINSSNS